MLLAVISALCCNRQALALVGLTAALVFALGASAQAATTHVAAATSLMDAMNAAISAYQEQHDDDITPIYASSSILARQIANGAPADVYISANESWMDWLARQGIELHKRADLLQNRLVLIAPKASDVQTFTPSSDKKLATLLREDQRLSVGDPDHVPAGIYAKQALKFLGEWGILKSRLARADNVRAALALVERGETPIGIVYQTDARASDDVRQLGLFPTDSHNPIIYPVALINPPVGEGAVAFREWLGEDEAMAIFAEFGFAPASTDGQ